MKKIFFKDIVEVLNFFKIVVFMVFNNKGDENKISKEMQKWVWAYVWVYYYQFN